MFSKHDQLRAAEHEDSQVAVVLEGFFQILLYKSTESELVLDFVHGHLLAFPAESQNHLIDL